MRILPSDDQQGYQCCELENKNKQDGNDFEDSNV